MKKIHRFRYYIVFAILMLVISIELNFLGRQSMGVIADPPSEDIFLYYMEMIDQMFSELQCFPVVKEGNDEPYPVNYENSWGAQRTYGGERTHEGCDLMAISNERGRFKVCSMTDGTVENIESAFYQIPEFIIIMHIWILMRRLLKSENEWLQVKFLEEWEIPDMERSRGPKESLQCIYMWEFI